MADLNNAFKTNNQNKQKKEELERKIQEFRNANPDAEELYLKRDAFQIEYDKLLEEQPNDTELLRLSKAKLDLLNYYIQRLILDYFKGLDRETEVINAYFKEEAKKRTQKESDATWLKSYSYSPLNDLICAFVSMGIPIAGDIANNFCVPPGPSSDCNAADISQYQGTCFNKYTDFNNYTPEHKGKKDNVGGKAQHLVWGEKQLHQGGCAPGLFGIGRQERGVCGLGYYMGDENTFNKTRCHLMSDDADDVGGWAQIGNLNHICAFEVGGNQIRGVDETFNYHTGYGPPELQYGASQTEQCVANSDLREAPTGHRAQCKLGYYDNHKIPENSTQCLQPIDYDWNLNENTNDACKKHVGFGQGDFNVNQPSQHTYGASQMLGKGNEGCWGEYQRAKCELGYSNGVKLEPWSTECVDRTDNMGQTCKNTYGYEWLPVPSKNSSWEQGCTNPAIRTRAVCKKDSDFSIGSETTNMAAEFLGQQCTDPNAVNKDTACPYYYGPNWIYSGNTQNTEIKNNTKGENYTGNSKDDCTGLFYRTKCKKVRELDDMKNAVCLWTNRSCDGKTCEERCSAIGPNWYALNPQKKCGYSGVLGTSNLINGESKSCICCNHTDYQDEENPYYKAILDTQGKVAGQKPYDWDWANATRVASKDLFLCKHSAFHDNHKLDGECEESVTTNLKDAHLDPGKKVYVPSGSDTELINQRLKVYKDMGPDQALFSDTTKWTWEDKFKKNRCNDYEQDGKLRSCIGPPGECGNKGLTAEGQPRVFNFFEGDNVTCTLDKIDV